MQVILVILGMWIIKELISSTDKPKSKTYKRPKPTTDPPTSRPRLDANKYFEYHDM